MLYCLWKSAELERCGEGGEGRRTYVAIVLKQKKDSNQLSSTGGKLVIREYINLPTLEQVGRGSEKTRQRLT